MYSHKKCFYATLFCCAILSTTGFVSAQNSTSETTPPKSSDSASGVTYFDAAQVNASFAKGVAVLFAGTEDGDYKIMTASRTTPGMAELHGLYTDVIYVIQGTATVVTGGKVVDGKTTEPNEIRGTGIQNGESRKLAKGDVIIIPKGTPHQFTDPTGPFLYYVVKVK